MNVKIRISAFFAAVLITLAGMLSAQAQNENGLMNVRIVTVKQDHLNDWIELQKQLTESMQKAGAPPRRIWQIVKGDHNTFHILTPLEGWADYDSSNDNGMGEAEWANWINKVSDTIQFREERTVRTYGFSIPQEEGAERKLVAVRYHTVKQGHNGDMQAWFEEKLVPALKKLDQKGRYFGRIITGGNVNTFYHARALESYADMGNWAFSNLSQKERDEIFTDERNSWVIESTQTLMRYRADLSFSDED